MARPGDLTYVDDIAAATIAATKNLGHEVINAGGGRKPSSLMEMIAIIEELLGKPAKIERLPVHKTDMADTQADITKADRLLGWRPTVDFRDGLERTVKWYRDNHTWASAIEV
jgi:UDP-glucuronate 4-epimerase